MIWLLPAMAAHALNAVVFVIDKALLGTKTVVGRPLNYAVYSSLVASGAAVLLVFAPAAPTRLAMVASLAAGVAWLAALWLFFAGLKLGEPSRVVPITGSAVPLFTLLLAAVFLGEKLSAQQLLGVGALIAGGGVLSLRLGSGLQLPQRALGAAVGAGAAFAAHFAIVDFIYDNYDPFLAAFAYSRLGVGAVALAAWLFLRNGGRLTSHSPTGGASTSREGFGWTGVVLFWFLASKGLGTLALILQNWAISLTSVTVVNALQGVQYVFLLLLAAGVSKIKPQFFREEWNKVSAGQKIAGVGLVSLGLFLVI